MIRSLIINKYLAKEFTKTVLAMTLTFFCLGFIMNLFEEINFFKDIDVGIYLPIMLSFLFIPSLLYNMFPFIILLSGIWFFLKIKKSDEITANMLGTFIIDKFDIPEAFKAMISSVFFIFKKNQIPDNKIIKGNIL